MKQWLSILIVAGILGLGPSCVPVRAADWAGVDETVIEKFAEKAGRPARPPFINTDRGDLLLFVFLLAGAFGGFAVGYWFRVLFPPRRATTNMVRQAHHDKEVQNDKVRDHDEMAFQDKDYKP